MTFDEVKENQGKGFQKLSSKQMKRFFGGWSIFIGFNDDGLFVIEYDPQ